MSVSSSASWGSDPAVGEAVRAAGWYEGRHVDVSTWCSKLASAGFELNDLAPRIWSEYGDLTIVSAPERHPASLHIDPVDACIDFADEARRMSRRLSENFSPLGMWGGQFRAYLGQSGKVLAFGMGTLWDLGDDFAQALACVVIREDYEREQEIDWLPYFGHPVDDDQ